MFDKLSTHIRRQWPVWLLTLIAAALTQRFLLTGSVGIDTELMLYDRSLDYHIWYISGRYCLIFLSRLLNPFGFSVMRSGILAILFLVCACVLWTFLWKAAGADISRLSCLSFSLLLVTSPVLSEQLYFKLQVQEICLCLCLSAVSVWLAFVFATAGAGRGSGVRRQPVPARARVCGVTSALLLTFLISCYQAFAEVFILGAVMMYLIQKTCLDRKNPDDSAQKDTPQDLRMIFRFILVFLAGYALNEVITRFVCGVDPYYAGGGIHWGTQPFKECLKDILYHGTEIFTGQGLFFTVAFPLLAVYVSVLLLLRTGSRGISRDTGTSPAERALLIAAYVLLLASPFLIEILAGARMPLRSMFPFSLLLAVLGCFATQLAQRMMRRKDATSGSRPDAGGISVPLLCATLFCLIAFCEDAYAAHRLSVTDDMRYAQDRNTAFAVEERITQLTGGDETVPVYFFGALESAQDAYPVRGEMFGASIFAWDYNAVPKGYWNSQRIIFFMHTLGMRHPAPEEDVAARIGEVADTLDVWPAQGSVQLIDGIVLMRFSE